MLKAPPSPITSHSTLWNKLSDYIYRVTNVISYYNPPSQSYFPLMAVIYHCSVIDLQHPPPSAMLLHLRHKITLVWRLSNEVFSGPRWYVLRWTGLGAILASIDPWSGPRFEKTRCSSRVSRLFHGPANDVRYRLASVRDLSATTKAKQLDTLSVAKKCPDRFMFVYSSPSSSSSSSSSSSGSFFSLHKRLLFGSRCQAELISRCFITLWQ